MADTVRTAFTRTLYDGTIARRFHPPTFGEAPDDVNNIPAAYFDLFFCDRSQRFRPVTQCICEPYSWATIFLEHRRILNALEIFKCLGGSLSVSPLQRRVQKVRSSNDSAENLHLRVVGSF